MITGEMIDDLAWIVRTVDTRFVNEIHAEDLADKLADFIAKYKRRNFDRERFLNDALPVSRRDSG